MKKIGNISLLRMNNGAHFLFISHIIQRAEGDSAVSKKAAAQIAALKTALSEENNKLKSTQKSMLTDEIATYDSIRGRAYSGYRKTVKGFLYIEDAEMLQAAKILNQHIKDYDIDPQMQIDKETGLMVNFLQDLEEKYTKHVETLKLTPFITRMKEANTHVITLTTKRTEERMNLTVGGLKNARNKTDEAYDLLIDMVNSLATVEGEEQYANFIDYVNTEIIHFKREVLGQSANPLKPSEGDDTDPDSGDDGDDDGESPDPIV